MTDIGDQKIEIGMPVEKVTRKLYTDMEDRGMTVYGLLKELPSVVQSTPFGRKLRPIKQR